MMKSICGCTPDIALPAQTIEFCGKPTLTWEGDIVNGMRRENSTLQFSTIHRLPEREHLAFIISAADGQQLLIGTKEGRYPVIHYTDTTGESGRTPAVRTYKITHIAMKSVIPCIL